MKKKVSILTYALARGGTEKVVSILIKELSTDYKIYLVLTSNIIEYPIPENVKLLVINDGNAGDNLFFTFLKLPFLSYRYFKFCVKNEIEISFSFLNRPNYIATMMRFFGWRRKIFISERTSTLLQYSGNTLKSLAGRYLVKKLYPKADLIIPNAYANMSDLSNVYKIKNNYKVIYNPINLQNILSRKNELADNFKDSRFTFLMLGRFMIEKDQSSLIEAFSLFKYKNESRLVLIGYGYTDKALKAKIQELKLESNVLIIDFVKNPYMYLSKVDCFVLSTIQEGFPNVLLEALACSLPVIASDCKVGPRELLAPGTDYNVQITTGIEVAEYGILVPVKNPPLLASSMERIYEDDNLRKKYREIALSRAKDFDIPLIIKEYKEILG